MKKEKYNVKNINIYQKVYRKERFFLSGIFMEDFIHSWMKLTSLGLGLTI